MRKDLEESAVTPPEHRNVEQGMCEHVTPA